jgi:hypothetical protein
VIKNLSKRFHKSRFVRSAEAQEGDLSIFKHKPSMRVTCGLVIAGISYIVGWPLVGLLGLLASHAKEPLIILIGGPIIYTLSHLLFILGAYLSGALYAKAFFRWALRMAYSKTGV